MSQCRLKFAEAAPLPSFGCRCKCVALTSTYSPEAPERRIHIACMIFFSLQYIVQYIYICVYIYIYISAIQVEEEAPEERPGKHRCRALEILGLAGGGGGCRVEDFDFGDGSDSDSVVFIRTL